MNYYNNDYDRGYTEATMSAADYMARTYRWMACGLAVTFGVALLTAMTPLFFLVNSLYLLLTIGSWAWCSSSAPASSRCRWAPPGARSWPTRS